MTAEQTIPRPVPHHAAGAQQAADANLRERLDRIPVHLGDAGDRVARRKYAAQARSDQAVAGLHVGVRRQVRQSECAFVAGTDRDRP